MMNNKKLFSLLASFLVAPTLLLAAPPSFENNNTACGSAAIFCADPSDCSATGAAPQSIACKSTSEFADFNNDGKNDCAALTSLVNLQAPPNTPALAILTQKSNSACNSIFSARNHALKGLQGADIRGIRPVGNVVVGNLDGKVGTEIAGASHFYVPAGEVSLDVRNIFQVMNSNNGDFGAELSLLPTVDVYWVTGGSFSPPFYEMLAGSDVADHNMALVDVDGNNTTDAVLAVFKKGLTPLSLVPSTPGNDAVVLNVLRNNGTGLQKAQDNDAVVVSEFTRDSVKGISLVATDLNNDSKVDVALAINAVGNNQVWTCLNGGNAAFTCSKVMHLNLGDDNPAPFSIVAGDFFGNGQNSLAVSEPGFVAHSRDVIFFKNNGMANFTAPQSVVIPGVGVPVNMTVGCFNNDDRKDVAVVNSISRRSAALTPSKGDIQIISFPGDINTKPDLTTLNYEAGPDKVADNLGIDSANLHSSLNDSNESGMDDLVALGSKLPGGAGNVIGRFAYSFVNRSAQFKVNAGINKTTTLNTPLTINDASCVFEPADPDRSAVHAQWTIVGAPVGVTLQNDQTLTPTFTATQKGTYTLQLKCNARVNCPAHGEATVKIDVSDLNNPGQQTPGGNTPDNNPDNYTLEGSGGCNLYAGNTSSFFNHFLTTMSMIGGSLLIGLKRRKKI